MHRSKKKREDKKKEKANTIIYGFMQTTDCVFRFSNAEHDPLNLIAF